MTLSTCELRIFQEMAPYHYYFCVGVALNVRFWIQIHLSDAESLEDLEVIQIHRRVTIAVAFKDVDITERFVEIDTLVME